MTLALKDLVHVSFKEVEPYWEDFAELHNLYLDHDPAIIGYRGNLYSLGLRSTWNEYVPNFIQHSCGRFGNLGCYIKSFRVYIVDLMNGKTIGEGTFDMAFRSANCHAMPKIKEAIRNAIIKVNMKSTDYYK